MPWHGNILALLSDSPAERARNTIGRWLDRFSAPSTLRGPVSAGDLQSGISRLFGPACKVYLESEGLRSIERHIERRRGHLDTRRPPFGAFHNGTTTLGRLCYAACRALRPRIVVETGVAYGVTSAYILQALADNGAGELHSLDLPPLGPDAHEYVGYLVPATLRTRWDLRIGPARALLPEVLGEGRLDLFLHDSLHTYGQMRWEFALAMDAMSEGGVLIADDIEGNRAFEEVLGGPRVGSWLALKEEGKDAVCGVVRTKPQGEHAVSNGSLRS